MEYYYTAKEYVSGNSLTIVDDEAKHLGRVLRKQSGSEIYVTDGCGTLYKTVIGKVTKDVIECTIKDTQKWVNEPIIKINLYQSLLKNPDRLEFAVEKSVELGVNEIHPVVTTNTINKTTDKHDRWQLIALSAMKQSQRCYLPKVLPPITFEEALGKTSSGLKLVADERKLEGSISISSAKTDNSETIDLFIGPEGGFTMDEVSLAIESGFKILNLGKRKFRSETAAVIAVGLLLSDQDRGIRYIPNTA
ncbi:MAG: 16S rRNA (uracil(1498)-N(3))-methyltransferase [Ignavibacteria bacterium]|nr:16S rRNA (uracil(1498)-N(3))-methyltransferase [Ignavibacteria bacterium]